MFEKKSILYLLFFTMLIYVVSANFDFKIQWCEFKCSSKSDAKAEDAPTNTKRKVTGYYWRDYSGIIPSDAFALGSETQSPQTFIGLVFDPENNGTFAVTVVDGLDYVYTGYNGMVHKIIKGIQILCTEEPDKMKWVDLKSEDRPPLDNLEFVKGGYYKESTSFYTFVTKVPDCDLNYASQVTVDMPPMDYVLADGTYTNSSSYVFLVYQKSESDENSGSGGMEKKTKPCPFISHHYEYSVRANSIIPNFYKSLKIGPCSMICTNEDKDSKKPDPSKDYFWTPPAFFSKDDAYAVGMSNRGETVWVGQTWNLYLGQSVGYSVEGELVYVAFPGTSIGIPTDVKILGTVTPEKLKWIPTNSTDVLSLDKSKLIRGGMMPNGTQVFVGRVLDNNQSITASVRVFDKSAYAFSSYYLSYGADKFEVLAHSD